MDTEPAGGAGGAHEIIGGTATLRHNQDLGLTLERPQKVGRRIQQRGIRRGANQAAQWGMRTH